MLVSATLTSEDLWQHFSKYTMEMILTKKGRKIFPKLEYQVHGMEPSTMYCVSICMKRMADHKWKFVNGEWLPSTGNEDSVPSTTVVHSNGIQTGEFWMSKKFNFDNVRLTNNPATKDSSTILLQSMHKYMPQLQIHEIPANQCQWSTSDTPLLDSCPLVSTIQHDFTAFVAVTAYQNENVKNGKIALNPFAKGFRASGERKRQSSSPESDISPKRDAFYMPHMVSPMTSPFNKMDQMSPPAVNPWFQPYYNMNWPSWYMNQPPNPFQQVPPQPMPVHAPYSYY